MWNLVLFGLFGAYFAAIVGLACLHFWAYFRDGGHKE